MDRTLTRLTDGGHFYEGPRWRDDRWYVSDFYAHEVFTITPDGHRETIMEVPGQPSGLGWLPDGSMLVVSMTDHTVLRRALDGQVSVHADISEHCGGKANDMVVDASGRAFIGNFGFDLMAGADPVTATLVRVDPDGAVTAVANDLYFPNGSVILPDEVTLVVGESIGCRYTAFTIGDDGSLTDRRVWAQLAPTPPLATFEETLAATAVAPDGCTLDAEGQIWAADALGARVIRVAEGGEITDQITMPEGLGAFACQLGGPEGTTLLICSAPDFAEQAREAAREAVLFTVDVGVMAAGRP
ncbi:SMP-30/gluconolactonase/LRE family protein [Euzebya tangerina]|uniref:SMP-30/gluconolactonase/LRE family protein n=1 Tax=Euzebya tangerina TaxID=591198 RepID=UPI000E321814|nr:SMP-30/gluconolactonase/LRE family protein [Euzebya tangerina]